MQYENNPANGFQDIVWKRNMNARPARHGDDNIRRSYFVGWG